MADLVFRAEGNQFHLVARENGTQKGHLQLTPEAIFVAANGEAKQLKYATMVAFMQEVVQDLDAMVTEAIDSIPAQEVPSEKELAAAAAKAEVIASMAAAQQQADAATLFSAGASFASKFKAENILDVKEDDSLICELRTGESDQSLMFKLSRIDRIDIEDLSAAENVTEITGDTLKAELENILKTVLPAQTTNP